MKQRSVVWFISGGLLMCCTGAALAGGSLTLAFTPDPTRGGGALSPEGCYLEPGPAQGLLTPTAAGSVCHSGLFGPFPHTGVRIGDLEQSVGIPASSFTTEPLAAPLTIGGRTTLGLYIANEEPGGDVYPIPEVLYRIEEIRSDGDVIPIASGSAMYAHGTYGVRGAGTFQIPVYTLAAGSRLRVHLTVSGPTSARLLFGDAPAAVGAWPEDYSFADAGITFEDAPEGSARALEGTIAGSFGLSLLPLVLLSVRRLSGARLVSQSVARSPLLQFLHVGAIPGAARCELVADEIVALNKSGSPVARTYP